MRPLGIPSLADRIRQQLVKLAIEPWIESKLTEHSCGFRPGRSRVTGLVTMLQGGNGTGESWSLLDTDIRKYFDTLPHNHLRKLLDDLPVPTRMRRYVDRTLTSPI